MGRILVVNNLATSVLWHHSTVVEPPDALIREIQNALVNFFWGGFHLTRSAVLLPVLDGGPGSDWPLQLPGSFSSSETKTLSLL